MGGEVWNGVVTRVLATRVETDPRTRLERWQVVIEARHGQSTMDFLLQRAEDGAVEQTCPAPGPDGWGDYPDYLWQHHPDVAPRVRHQGRWLINLAMLGRGIVSVDPSSSSVEVHHEHVSNVHEVLYCALAPLPWTIVHASRRYGFGDRQSWQRAVDRLAALRSRISFKQGRAGPPLLKKKRTNSG